MSRNDSTREAWYGQMTGPHDLCDEGCQQLMGEVYLGATREWRRLRADLKGRPGSRDLQASLLACERFLTRGWCALAMNIDGENILQMLKEEADG